MVDEVISVVDCIIYGAGRWGTYAYEEYKDRYNILFFVDNDTRKQGTLKCGLPIMSLDSLKNFKETFVLISVLYQTDKIKSKLFKIGVKNIGVYFEGITYQQLDNTTIETRNIPSLLVDCTRTTRHNDRGGLPRVVNKVIHELRGLTDNILPALFIDDYPLKNMIYEGRYIKGEINANSLHPVKRVIPVPGDRFLALDSCQAINIKAVLYNMSVSKTETFVVLYDMIPILHPEFCSSSSMVESCFDAWHAALEQADNIITISKSVADEIATYFKDEKISRKQPLPLFYFPMGNDIISRKESTNLNVRQSIKTFLNGMTFLMVGTIEPRKDHLVVLQALKNIDNDVRLIIIGYDGWKNNEIKDVIGTRKNVLWINDATDEELHYCYQHATALIQASKTEGYGLPLIEAAQFGLPIICSDIPVFREVTEGQATFFKVSDANDLAMTLINWLNEDTHPDSSKIKIHTWRESAKALLDIVYGNAEPYKILY